MMKYLPIILAIGTVLLLLRIFRVRIVRWLIKLRSRLHIQSLRTAISEADKDKAETQRKNMVVFNTVSGQFEPLQKKVLKQIEQKGKNKNNGKMTEGRKKFMREKKKLLNQPVKQIEEKSLYVTK